MNVNDCICELMFISEKCFPIDPEIASEDLNTDHPYDTTAIDGYRADDLQRTLNNIIDLLRFLRKMYPDIFVDHSEGPDHPIRGIKTALRSEVSVMVREIIQCAKDPKDGSKTTVLSDVSYPSFKFVMEKVLFCLGGNVYGKD